jgi:hypothetical protein
MGLYGLLPLAMLTAAVALSQRGVLRFLLLALLIGAIGLLIYLLLPSAADS